MGTLYGEPEATYAKIIADSINSTGQRITTMEVQFHRFVLAEFNTHRVFSRNSASSRAIPVDKQIERVLRSTAYPLVWPAEQKGMQGGDAISPNDAAIARGKWRYAASEAVRVARDLQSLNVHKSIINRILEPFMWHKVIVTSTEWSNFFLQRCSPLAQPEIRAVAELMRDAFNDSVPEELAEGEWHMPYITSKDVSNFDESSLLKISAARCARVSYLTHDGVRDPKEDIDLFYKLVKAKPAHWSPLEHVATSNSNLFFLETEDNFQEWIQLRTLVRFNPEGWSL